jgi:hypothetical protein
MGQAFIFSPKFKNMKATLILLLFAIGVSASAQSVSTTVKFNKKDKPALMLYLPYSQEVAEAAILTKLKETGFEPESTGTLLWKQDKIDGFYAFKGVTLKGDKTEVVDLYFKVDRRGSKKDNQSVMYLMTSKGGDNFVPATSENSTFASSQRFLNGFVSETATYKHTLDLKAQEENIIKAEKKLTTLLDDEKTLNEKIAKLQAELKDNKNAQNYQQAVVDAEKKKLAEMKTEKL